MQGPIQTEYPFTVESEYDGAGYGKSFFLVYNKLGAFQVDVKKRILQNKIGYMWIINMKPVMHGNKLILY